MRTEVWIDPEIIEPKQYKLYICKCIDLKYSSKKGAYVCLEVIKPIWKGKGLKKYLCSSGNHNCLVYRYTDYVDRFRNY